MAITGSIIVSGSWYVPGTTIATGSVAALTASLTLGVSQQTIIISGSNYTGSFYLNSGSLGATSSIGAITASLLGGLGFNTILVNFQTSTGSASGSVAFTPVTYVMSGYFLAGGSRETWSGNSINTPNPTGHTLVDVTVMGSYPPQNSAT